MRFFPLNQDFIPALRSTTPLVTNSKILSQNPDGQKRPAGKNKTAGRRKYFQQEQQPGIPPRLVGGKIAVIALNKAVCSAASA